MENIFCNFNFQFAARSRVNHPLAISQGRLTQTTFIQKKLHSNKQIQTCKQATTYTQINTQAPSLKQTHSFKQTPSPKQTPTLKQISPST